MSAALGCVVLTTGRRPAELAEALASLLRQRDVAVDAAVVGNGWRPEGLPPGVRGVHEPVDRGIPAGRNAGVPHVRGELLFFLDDDATLEGDDALARVAAMFADDPGLGAVQLRVVPRGGGEPLREWSSHLRPGAAERGGEITALWEGAVAIRRDLFERVGGWPEEFRFVHEGVDLAWRVLDAGYRVQLAADVTVLHPLPEPGSAPARHGYSLYFGARNRVFLARRHLPAPLGAVFVATFALRSLPRLRSATDVRRALRGYRAGLRAPCGERRPLRPRTLWRMTRAGRPPII